MPRKDLIREFRAWHKENAGTADYITMSGSGEPTLHAELGDIIRAIKDLTDTPVAVLTNGALFSDAAVRRDCALADLVLPTLAATSLRQYRHVHRPFHTLGLASHVRGLMAFRHEHATPMWLELFLIEGINASLEDLSAFRVLVRSIAPDRVQLNTAVRPPSEEYAQPVSPMVLRHWATTLGREAEVIAEFSKDSRIRSSSEEAAVFDLCRRRPCTLNDIASGLGVHTAEAAKLVGNLSESGWVTARRRDGRTYFVASVAEGTGEGEDGG